MNDWLGVFSQIAIVSLVLVIALTVLRLTLFNFSWLWLLIPGSVDIAYVALWIFFLYALFSETD